MQESVTYLLLPQSPPGAPQVFPWFGVSPVVAAFYPNGLAGAVAKA